jgi:hypothetical protein
VIGGVQNFGNPLLQSSAQCDLGFRSVAPDALSVFSFTPDRRPNQIDARKYSKINEGMYL